MVFQSTLPVWGATPRSLNLFKVFVVSIHAPRVGSDPPTISIRPCANSVSIHAPRVGSDGVYISLVSGFKSFNPRSPCGERRNLPVRRASSSLFQSTLPVWGATKQLSEQPNQEQSFNPRSPCGERLKRAGYTADDINSFNPRSPCGERLILEKTLISHISVSIHAPRVGSD